jgi:Concanavalin A-like lectin/glucanases superfamily
MSALSVQTMARLLTQPYRRGSETLEVPVGADGGGFTQFNDYDFREYLARYGTTPPESKYVLYLKVDVPQSDVEVGVRYSFSGAEQEVMVHVPGGSLAGTSFHIPIPAGSDASLRLTRFRQSPVALARVGAQNFGAIALLGNIAKLAWVLGEEKDQIRRHIKDVMVQRHIALAHGASLDALGDDLRVPRFPGRQYSFDPNTLALYHLDEIIAGNGVVADDTARFGLAGHPGTNQNAQSGVTGKFGKAFRFPGTGATSAVEIATSSAFDLTASQSFTTEAFIKADVNNAAAPSLIASKGQLNAAGALIAAGWSLMIGSLRGTANNLRWAGNDGANSFEIFSDLDLNDGQFHHVAGVLDRSAQRARLLVDGAVMSTVDISGIAALTNALPIRVGSSTLGHQYFGVIDEMRFSQIARTEFDPALGEGDNSYRKRLGIFRSWQLPTPPALLQTINGLIQINGQPDSFVLIEQNKQSVVTSNVVRVIPASLAPGQSIGKDGNPLAKEEDVSGTPDQDADFQGMFLLRHDNPQADYGGVENNRLMQVGTARVLDSLLNLLAVASPAIAGQLVVHKSFDPADVGLHSVGRALNLAHQTLTLDQLAVFAHRAGADFVGNDGTNVHISVAASEKLSIGIEPRAATEIPPDGSDVFAGHVLDVDLLPAGVSSGGLIQWTLILDGSGRATLLPHPADPNTVTTPVANRPRLRVHADAPGEVTLRVEYTLKRKTVTGTRTLQITVDSLTDGQAITADGDLTATESATVSDPGPALNPAYLITPNITVNFGGDPNNKLTQIVVEKPLLQLLTLLTAVGAAPNNLQILKSFDPADPGLHKVGRAIRLSHPGIDPGKLAALAHQAGFDFVRREAAVVYGSVEAGEKIQIALAAGLTPLPAELTLGAPVNLRARFTALPAKGTYNWSFQPIGNGSGTFDFVLRPQVNITPKATGLVGLSLNFLEDDPAGVFPYSFEIRLKDSLNVAATIIPKPQYDILMNILSYFHPIGVEVITRNIREHVVEVKDNLLNAFPGYTYPDFRI